MRVEDDVLLVVGHPDAVGLGQRDRGHQLQLGLTGRSLERAGSHALFVFARQPEPVVVARLQTGDLHVDLGTGGLRSERRALAVASSHTGDDHVGTGRSAGTDEQHDGDDRGGRGNERRHARRDATRPTIAPHAALDGNPAEDPTRERVRRFRGRTRDVLDWN